MNDRDRKRLGWIRRAEAWVQMEIGAHERLLELLERHHADLIAGAPDAVESTARELDRAAEARADSLAGLDALLAELGPTGPTSLARVAAGLGAPATDLLGRCIRLRELGTRAAERTRRVTLLCTRQRGVVREVLTAVCGLAPGAELESARGALVDGTA